MITIRPASERGHADRGWLQSKFTFSFAEYFDPSHMGFRTLRVINEDRVAPGKGFGPHAHRDMEILTYVIDGSLMHRDSMGEEHVVRPNEIQLMSAGSGVVHSEFNASTTAPVHFFQIWILPGAEDLKPSYQQISFAPHEKQNRLRLIVAPRVAEEERAAVIHQDAKIYVAEIDSGGQLQHDLKHGRYAWVQVTKGAASVNGQALGQGDGIAIADEQEIKIVASNSGSEVLLFDLT